MDFCNLEVYTFGMGSIDSAYVLVGIKHSGKTTLGKLLAQRLECKFCDTDEVIAKNTGLSARELYSQKGPAQFMLIEEKVCRLVYEKFRGTRAVVATGGGLCDNAPALEYLRALGSFVMVSIAEETAANRIVKKMTVSPSGKISDIPAYIARKNPKSEEEVRAFFHEFYEPRDRAYRSFADKIVECDDSPKDRNFERLVEALGL